MSRDVLAAVQLPDRRLLSRHLRPLVGALLVLAAAVAAVLGLRYAGTTSPGRIDRAVDGRLITGFGAHGPLVRVLADVGSPVPIVLATLVLVLTLVHLKRRRAALLAAAAPVLAGVLTEWVLKPAIGRTHDGSLSFPSGHAAGSCAVAIVLVVLILDRCPPRLPTWLQIVATLGAAALAVTVCVAVVAAQYHYATDALGGACVALVSVLTLCLVIDGVADRRTLRAGWARGPRPPGTHPPAGLSTHPSGG